MARRTVPSLRLAPREKILTAFAETARGPGWHNRPIWVVIVAPDRSIRVECIQPEDHSGPMIALYEVSEAAHSAMKLAAKAISVVVDD